MSTTTKTAKILQVIFPWDAAMLRGSDNDFTAELSRKKTNYSGWDVRKDIAKGMRSDTGRNCAAVQYNVHNTGYGFQMPARDVTRLHTPQEENYGIEIYSLLPPVASL